MYPNPAPSSSGSNHVIHYALQLLALAILLVWCFNILTPFLIPLLWGAVFASSFFPIHEKLIGKYGWKNSLSATFITLIALSVLIVPAVFFMIAGAGEIKELAEGIRDGDLKIPPPNEQIKSWPLIGERAFAFWTEASTNLTLTIQEHQDQLKPLLLKLVALLKNTAGGVLLLMISIIISGIMLAYEKEESDFARKFLVKLAGRKGEDMAGVAKQTVQNVVKGILGVAAIQTTFVGIGLLVADIPFAGLWIILSLILAIVQIGILPVSIGVIIYIWTTGDSVTATILTIWMLVVGLMDNVLKPIFLGKGASVPMLVVFLGAIGGFIYSGFIGLFTGAIVLTLAYKLGEEWLNSGTQREG
ncbi:AI-2E family transporter [Algoriphagus jejuensis]|uniref:AI-2E family transporter n=1 Tax=Algoriphagus jejuensis TaxID=419934 RepID=A0ABN1MWG8_9BACT